LQNGASEAPEWKLLSEEMTTQANLVGWRLPNAYLINPLVKLVSYIYLILLVPVAGVEPAAY
jgi:hypothetical protein